MKKIMIPLLGLSIALFADMSKTGNIVTDNDTLLQWQDNTVDTPMNWSSSLLYCEDLILDGYSDWRLPNVKELTSIIDDSRVDPAIYPTFEHIGYVYPNDYSIYYWSSTTQTYDKYRTAAWLVKFDDGGMSHTYKSISCCVRCVRAGQ